jgi:hypothetical protein
VATYSAITNGEIDPDSPLTTSLATKWRDNPISAQKGRQKPAIETIQSDTTLSDDDTLVFNSLPGGFTLYVEFYIRYTLVGGGQGFKYSVVTSDPANDVGYFGSISINSTQTTAPGAGTFAITLPGTVVLDATPDPGYIKFQWSQNVLLAIDTSVEAGSWAVVYHLDAT